MIRWTGEGKYEVNENYSINNSNAIFLQNTEQYTRPCVQTVDRDVAVPNSDTVLNK